MQGDILRKGQIQIQESILVLVTFTVILLIGLILFYNFAIAGIKADILSYENEKFQSLISVIPSMAEFRCSNLGQDQECIDLSKVRAFIEIKQDYGKVFGQKTIELQFIYPNEDKKYVIYSKKSASVRSARKISTLVSVYDVSQDKYKIGKLTVEAYS